MNKEYKITVKHVLNTRLKGVSNGVKTFYPLYIQVSCRRQITNIPSKWNFDFTVEDFDSEKKSISHLLQKEKDDIVKIIKILDPSNPNFSLRALTKLYSFLCRDVSLNEYIQENLKNKIEEYGESLINTDLVSFEIYKYNMANFNSYSWKKSSPISIINDIFTQKSRSEILSKYHAIVWQFEEWEKLLIEYIRTPKLSISKTYYVIDFVNGEFEQDLNNYFQRELFRNFNISVFDKVDSLEITQVVVNSIKELLESSMNEWKRIFI